MVNKLSFHLLVWIDLFTMNFMITYLFLFAFFRKQFFENEKRVEPEYWFHPFLL